MLHMKNHSLSLQQSIYILFAFIYIYTQKHRKWETKENVKGLKDRKIACDLTSGNGLILLKPAGKILAFPDSFVFKGIN